MSSKRRHVEKHKITAKQVGGDSSTEESSDEDEYTGNEQIQVDFEGRSPEEADFHGIKQLLRQLFLKASIDLSQFTDIIIKQKSIGSVVKQCDDNPENDNDEDDMETDQDDVYGITTVIPLRHNEHLQCVKHLQSYILQKTNAHALDDVKARLRELLESETIQTGFLLNERFVNIPPQISVPLLQNLSKEIKKAVEKKNLPNFDFYILICKLYKMSAQKLKKKGKKSATLQETCIWSNPEEEIIAEMAECSFEFSVKGYADTALGGTWKESDTDMVPWRRILLLNAKSLDSVIEKVVMNLS